MTIPQPNLDRLTRRLSVLIGVATGALEADPARVGAWQAELTRQLRRYHLAAFIAGNDGHAPDAAARQAIDADIATQLKFLGKFALEIQDADTWQAGWNARAAMYARSIQVPYWQGKTKMLPLPAMPGDGTTACLTQCRCAWNVQQLDGDNNYDAYWVYGATERHCQGCQQRENEWNPLRIRNGELL